MSWRKNAFRVGEADVLGWAWVVWSPFLRPFPIRVNLHCKLCHAGLFNDVEPRMQKLSLKLFWSFNVGGVGWNDFELKRENYENRKSMKGSLDWL